MDSKLSESEKLKIDIGDQVQIVRKLDLDLLLAKNRLEELQTIAMRSIRSGIVAGYLKKWSDPSANAILFEVDEELVNAIFYLGGHREKDQATPTTKILATPSGDVVIKYFNEGRKEWVVL